MKQVLLKIEGIVQGVNFRWYAKERAIELGITGWVKNNKDGSVKVCAQAEEARLNQFIEWCSNGPGSAKVTKITKTYQTPDLDLEGFKTAY